MPLLPNSSSLRTHAAPANRRLRENEGLPNQPFNDRDIYRPSTDMAAVDNNNDDQAPSLVRVRCFHQPRPSPQQGGGMDFFLEITGDNVSKIIGSTRHLWTLTAAGAAIAPVWKVLCIFARRLYLPTEAEEEVQNLLDASTIFQVGSLEGRSVGEALLRVHPKRPLRCEPCI